MSHGLIDTKLTMTVTSRHEDVFGGRSHELFIFLNDYNSKNSIQKLVEAEALEKANKEKLENEAAELQKLRTAATEYEREIDGLKHQLSQFLQDYKLMKIRLNQEYSRWNLDHSYHEREVFIVMACPPHTALDLGASNGTAPHGYELNRDCPWQGFRLRRTNTSAGDKTWITSTWTISSTYNTDRYLGVTPNTDKVESQAGRWTGENAMYQEWWIGLNSAKTGYLFESRLKGFLNMESPRENTNGKAITQVSNNETDALTWHIILK